MEHTSHDSLSIARRIGEAGMEQTQADAIAWAIRDTFKEASADLATKADLAKLDAKINKLDDRIDKLDARIDELDARMDKLDARMDKLEARMDKLEARMDRLEARMDKLEAKVQKLDAKVDRLDIKIDALDASLRAELSWMPLRVCWWMLLTFSTAAGLVLAAQQLWSSGLLQTWFG